MRTDCSYAFISFKEPTFSTVLHPADTLSGIHLASTGRHYFHPFLQRCFSLVPRPSRPVCWMNKRPTCRKLPVKRKMEKFLLILCIYSIPNINHTIQFNEKKNHLNLIWLCFEYICNIAFINILLFYCPVAADTTITALVL